MAAAPPLVPPGGPAVGRWLRAAAEAGPGRAGGSSGCRRHSRTGEKNPPGAGRGRNNDDKSSPVLGFSSS